MHDQVGQHLGNYRVLRLLGQGGKASVYLGEHVSLGSHAALKVLHTHLTEADAEAFLREAQTLARLSHPHIVRVLDFAVQEGVPFLVMEYASGGTLRLLHPKGTRLPLETIVSYVTQVASALQYAHDQRLMHRDVKPENMLRNAREEVLLGDFGLAMLAPHTLSASTQAMDPSITGTLPYLAPEQVQGRPCPASDQYALGVVVYEWLCGRPPFAGSPIEIAMQLLSAPPPSLQQLRPALSPSIEDIVLRALAKEPKLRFASVYDFATAFARACQEGRSPHSTFVRASPFSTEREHSGASMRHLPTGTLTLLFTDIEGSTGLLQQLGERYADVLAECRHLLRTAFHAFGGHEVDTQGDAFFVAFARATDGVSATVAAQRALAGHSWPEGVVVRARMGLHTGEPQLTSEGYVGLDVHHAARIMSAGHGGQILLSQTTHDLVEHDLPPDVSLRDVGQHRLKDLGRPVRLFQVIISDLPADFPPLKTLDTHPNNLPVQPTPLVGREREVAQVCELLHRYEVRLVTLTGPGGIGKTRLGVQVAAELSDLFVDGIFFVDLAPLSDPALVVPTIAQRLGIWEGTGQSLLERLKEGLQQKQALLLLDNFEQVLSAAVQVADLLTACPRLKVLVTSRERLHVRAEQEFSVPPLALPATTQLPDLAALAQYEAVALFLQRAQATKPDFQLTTANARAVAEICARLDGLPLAIELAAARIKLLPPPALLARLAHRLQVLTSGAQDVPVRQQTLRNTIAWSYHLLDAQEQRLFRRLAVFVGGCTLEAVEAVCEALGDERGKVFDGVASLIDKSLVQQRAQKEEEPRLVMLETIREYGLEALTEGREMEVARQAHADYYLRFSDQAEPALEGPQQAVWLDRLEREHDNLRAAMQWALERGEAEHSVELALRLGGVLQQFWQVRGYLSEGRTFLERALAGSKGAVTSSRAKALTAAASLAVLQADTDQGEVLCEESLALCRELGDTAGIAHTLHLLGLVAWQRSKLAGARSLFEESLALWREAGDKNSIASALYYLAWLALQQGEYARARILCEESLSLSKQEGNKRGIALALFKLAQIFFSSQGDPASVRSLIEESLTLSRALGDTHGLASCFCLSGQLALQQGDAAMARSLVEEGLVLYREIGDWEEGIGESLTVLGKVAAVEGDYTAARAFYEESLAFPGKVDTVWTASSLEGLAGVVAAQGEPLWAVRLYGAAEALRESVGTPIPPVERTTYERSVAAARAQLGEKTFATAWAEGRIMTVEQVLAAQGSARILTPSTGSSPAPPARKPATYPDGLTAREVEVLRLVAQGLTNEQVAEQLVISPRTVNTHLTAIYGKIQVSSRSAATRYAIDHHLV